MHKGFHLQIFEGPHTFVMASEAGISIVDRKDLLIRGDQGEFGAVELSRDNQDWTAVRLAHLLAIDAGDWAQAIFIENDDGDAAVVVAQQVRFTEKDAAGVIKPYTVIGLTSPDTPLFNGVWVKNDSTQLILDRKALAEAATAVHSS